ncbi:hypothetical protein ACH54D_20695 [Atlantibacter hermannii]|uniref:hypothetical protein n=1 Tax=Atlantibacter hermannii TaxID=565 RepID=UPI00378F7024
MTTFTTAATVARIIFITDCALEDLALTTMKNAKDGIANRSRVLAGYESNFAGVDLAAVIEMFKPVIAARTKAACKAALEAIAAKAVDMKIEDERAEMVRDTIRIANRDHGVWLTADQINARTCGMAYNPATVARELANEVKDAERAAQEAAALTAAQEAYNAAADASEAALNAAVEADTTGTMDTPEFIAYEATEAHLMIATTDLLQAGGRVAVETARRIGKPVADIEALKLMFQPAFTGNTENMHPGRRNELVALCLKIKPE